MYYLFSHKIVPYYFLHRLQSSYFDRSKSKHNAVLSFDRHENVQLAVVHHRACLRFSMYIDRQESIDSNYRK